LLFHTVIPFKSRHTSMFCALETRYNGRIVFSLATIKSLGDVGGGLLTPPHLKPETEVAHLVRFPYSNQGVHDTQPAVPEPEAPPKGDTNKPGVS